MPPAAGIHLLAALLLALPFLSLIFLPPGFVPASFVDALEFIWTIGWNKEVLLRGARPYFTDWLFFPDGASLLLHATVEGLTLPLTALLLFCRETTIFNLACYLALVLNYCAALSLFHLLTPQQPRLAAVLALLFAIHPYFLAHLDGGQLNFLCLFPLLVTMRSWFAMLKAGRASPAELIPLTSSLAALALVNLYYFYYALLASAVLAAVALLRRSLSLKDYLSIAAAAGLSGLLVSFKLLPLFELAAGGSYSPNHDPRIHSGDVLSFLLPGSAQLLGQVTFPLLSGVRVNTAESGLYLGYALLLLVALLTPAAFRLSDRRTRTALSGTLVLGFLFTMLTLGPVLQFSGKDVLPTGVYEMFRSLLPAFPSVPARFGIMAILSAFCLAAFGCAAAQRTSTFVKCCLAVLLLEYAPLPPQARLVTWETPALAKLGQDEQIRSVVDAARSPQEAMMRQLVHHKPIAGGFLSRRPIEAERKYRNNAFVRFLVTEGTPSPVRLRAGFAALEVSAVVSAKTDPAYERLLGIPWLQLWEEDARVAVFVPIWAPE